LKTKERNSQLNYKQTLEIEGRLSLGIVRVKRFIFEDESSLRLDRFLFQRAIEDVSRMVHLGRFRFYCFASFHSSTPFALGCNSFFSLFFSYLIVDGDARISGNDATKFFALSNLSRSQLKHVYIPFLIVHFSIYNESSIFMPFSD